LNCLLPAEAVKGSGALTHAGITPHWRPDDPTNTERFFIEEAAVLM
jgi:hypothetical protein